MTVSSIGTTGFQLGATKTEAAPRVNPPARLELPPIELPTQSSLARDTESFAAGLATLFREAGISVPPGDVFGSDSNGQMHVANTHPDKTRIESLLNDAPGLQRQYAKLSAQSSLLRAAENHVAFAAEYGRLKGNPAAQAALVEATVARNKAPFHLVYDANGARIFFSENASA